MKGTVLYGPRDVRFEERPEPRIDKPTDAIIRISATCVCGSDLWPYRGIQSIAEPTPMGHEYCGIVEEVGSEVKKVKPGQFVIGSFLPLITSAPIARQGTKRLASDASLSVRRKRQFFVLRSRMERWWRHPMSRPKI